MYDVYLQTVVTGLRYLRYRSFVHVGIPRSRYPRYRNSGH
nr:MAG TPA: hypothetical protein [Caudoviricetes sp.]